MQHHNICDIFEVQLEIEQTNCSIYQVLEGFEGDLQQDIEERGRSNRPYQEVELRQVLLQMTSALACAHSKRIAHRNVSPGNIYRIADTYKLGDFGCFFFDRERSIDEDFVGDTRYMSPQLRYACMRMSKYNVFKANVFSLAASLLHMATLASPKKLVASEALDEVVGREIATLPVSGQLKNLLQQMLAYEENQRPTMQEVYDALTTVPVPSAPVEELKQSERIAFEGYEVDAPLVPHNINTRVDVHSGKRLATNEAVVIKTFTCDSLKEANLPLSEGLAQARFEHPNVCRLLDIRLSGEASQCRVHLVMEKMEHSLLQEIKLRAREKRPLSEAQMKAFLAQMGDAMKLGKDRKIAHRDIKPENILIDARGHYKLCDFGSAWERLSITLTNSTNGTLPYMCRQVRLSLIDAENRYDPFKADIFSLGMTTLYLSALEPPFRPNANGPGSVNISDEVIGRLSVSPGLKQLLQKMVSEEERQRPDIETVLSNLR